MAVPGTYAVGTFTSHDNNTSALPPRR